MNDKQRRRFERHARVRAFVAENASDFPPTGKGGQAAARLNDIHAQVETLDTSRVTNRSEKQRATTGRRDERASLRERLAVISDTAETIGLDYPEVKGVFKWSREGMSDQTLLATARALAASAAPLKARFVEYDLPPDFLEGLNASIEEFDQHILRQTATKGTSVAATASLEDALKRGDEEVERLDTSVRNKYRADPARMAAWESACHLEQRAPRTARTVNTGTPTAPQ
jgi:hypothetical protein